MRASLNSRWTIALLIQAFALTLVSIGECDEPTITVTGDAEIRVVPDQVVISAGVESRAKTVAATAKDNDGKVHAIVEFLRRSGIEDKHIHTEYISIEPIMREGRWEKGGNEQVKAQSSQNDDLFGSDEEPRSERPIGYLASRQFAITITDLKSFETVYKGLIELGINRVRGIEFRTSDLRKHRDKARLEAVRAAREKAQAMSGELGATLASIKTIHETSGGGYGGRMYQNSTSDPFGLPPSPSDGASTFAAGQIAITASVEIVFVLGNTELKR
ncbi:MAG: SIMPL domain-containing protein [Pirellulales bacterium]